MLSIGTICLPKTFQIVETIKAIHTDIKAKNYNMERSNTKLILVKGKTTNKFEPIVIFKDKLYPKTNYKHQLRNVQIDETLTKVKAQKLNLASCTLTKEQHLTNLNPGIQAKP